MSTQYNEIQLPAPVVLTPENVERFARSQRDIKAYIDVVNSLRGKGMGKSVMSVEEIFDTAKKLL